MQPTDRQLSQYLARAIEPPAEEEVRRWLSVSASARARLARLEVPVERPGPAWSLPPPGVSGAWLSGSAQPAAVMDTAGGGWLEVSLDVPVERLGDAIVVLERATDWVVTFPSEGDEDITASMLETTQDGRRRLDLMPGVDTLRLAVVLCPPAMVGRRDWTELRDQLMAGLLPATTVDVAAIRNRSRDAS